MIAAQAARREALRDGFRFDCDCARCRNGTETDAARCVDAAAEALAAGREDAAAAAARADAALAAADVGAAADLLAAELGLLRAKGLARRDRRAAGVLAERALATLRRLVGDADPRAVAAAAFLDRCGAGGDDVG